MMQVIIFVLSLIAVSQAGPGDMYKGYKMLKVLPQSQADVGVLDTLEHDDGTSDGILYPLYSPKLNRESDILVSLEKVDEVLKLLEDAGIKYRVHIEDVGRFIQAQKVLNKTANGRISWDAYYTYGAIWEFIEAQRLAYPNLVEILSMGATYEGRDFRLMKISTTPVGGPQKPVIWLESTIHAREWITSAVSTHIIDQLLNGPDPILQGYLNDFDFYIVPIANPDGFIFTHTSDRFWRKTRSDNPLSPIGCKGADPNRNWDQYWMEAGASKNPCSNTYAGLSPFSEPETLAMARFMNSSVVKYNLIMFMSLHSAGQMLLIPTGLNSNPIPDYDQYMEIAGNAATAHHSVHGMEYVYGSVHDVIYPATGSTMDWAYFHINTRSRFHVTYELRDKGNYGHLLPPEQIKPQCEEFIEGFKVIMNYMRG